MVYQNVTLKLGIYILVENDCLDYYSNFMQILHIFFLLALYFKNVQEMIKLTEFLNPFLLFFLLWLIPYTATKIWFIQNPLNRWCWGLNYDRTGKSWTFYEPSCWTPVYLLICIMISIQETYISELIIDGRGLFYLFTII